MTFYRRRLPHLYRGDLPVFVTWRLYGSLPSNRCFPAEVANSGEAFAVMDRLLDEGRTGPVYLRQTAIAEMVVEVILYCEEQLGHYELHAFVVMANHVHVLLSPRIELPKVMKALKGFTAKRANQTLGLTGSSFWQEESYDHLVRDRKEFEGIKRYIENNPVRAGLVKEAREYRWSSAGWGTGRSPRTRRSAPPYEGTAVDVLDYLDVDHLLEGQYAAKAAAGTRPVEILIVEDNPADLLLTKTALRDAGIVHEVSVVRDGERALARLRRQGRYVGATRPDVVLLDINLPRVNGHQVLEQMRADPDLKRIPVIVLSGYAVRENMKRPDDATTYLVKPIRLKEYLSIAQAIKDVCDLVELPEHART